MPDQSKPLPLMEVMRDLKEFLYQRHDGFIRVNLFLGGITNWNITEVKRQSEQKLHFPLDGGYESVMKDIHSFLMQKRVGNIEIHMMNGEIVEIIKNETRKIDPQK